MFHQNHVMPQTPSSPLPSLGVVLVLSDALAALVQFQVQLLPFFSREHPARPSRPFGGLIFASSAAGSLASCEVYPLQNRERIQVFGQ